MVRMFSLWSFTLNASQTCCDKANKCRRVPPYIVGAGPIYSKGWADCVKYAVATVEPRIKSQRRASHMVWRFSIGPETTSEANKYPKLWAMSGGNPRTDFSIWNRFTAIWKRFGGVGVTISGSTPFIMVWRWCKSCPWLRRNVSRRIQKLDTSWNSRLSALDLRAVP